MDEDENRNLQVNKTILGMRLPWLIVTILMIYLLCNGAGSDKPPHMQSFPPLDRVAIQKLDSDYRDGLRSLLRVEGFIASAVSVLKESGEYDNTYIVFYTDNGAHFGHHRLPHGKFYPYQEDTNFPLYVVGPGIPTDVTEKLVGNHDIAPTLAEMGGPRFRTSLTAGASSRSPRILR